MRAVVIHAPKDLRIDSFPDPAPAAGEVRIKIAANRRDVPYQSLLKVFLAERLARERQSRSH